MTEAMPFLQKYDITFLRPPPIPRGLSFSPSSIKLLPAPPHAPGGCAAAKAKQ